MDWQKILIIVVAVLVAFWLFRYIRSNPEALSRENLSKSFWTLGVLGLLLVGFIGLLVMFLRSS